MKSFKQGMVSTAQTEATAVGLNTLQRGGNAVDAAIAISFMLTVTEPQNSGLGGGGFWTVWLAKEQRAFFLDFRNASPAAALPEIYYRPDRTLADLTQTGPLAVAVPGMPRGLAHAAARYGDIARHDLASLIDPAIHCAANGFTIYPYMARVLSSQRDRLLQTASTAAIYAGPEATLAAGQTLRNPHLAASLRQIRDEGLETLSSGPLAERIAAYLAANGGLVALADMAAYQPIERELLRGSYRGHEIWTAPPPSAGGIRLLQVLNFMEQFPIGELGHNSAATLHVIAEALKHSRAACDHFIADPLSAPDAPVAELIDKAWALARQADFAADRAAAHSYLDAGSPDNGGHTTHFSVMDPWGNIVAATQTQGISFGSAVVAGDTGLLLNGEMNDFDPDPANVNAVRPHRRPRSNMCPTIVRQDGETVLVVGAPGGTRIPSAVIQAISNVLDHGLPLQAAADAPRIHWEPGMLHVEDAIRPDVITTLRDLGHPLNLRPTPDVYFAAIHAIQHDPATGELSGAADRRLDGNVLGY
ncbi:MAG: gamma-glutamyltransferase [Ardenticatenales bacterium]|nr:gamma-glutamyltransferase [Ardenticatenales bacterium]